MAHVKGDQVKPRAWRSRLALTAVWGMAVLSMFGSPGLAQEASSGKDAAKAQSKECKPADRPAFDLSYLPEDASGIIACRPAALFSQPGMDKIARLIDIFFVKEFGLRIEEIVAECNIDVSTEDRKTSSSAGKKPCKTIEHYAKLGMGSKSLLLRTTKDVDWEKLIQKFLQPYYVKHKKVSYHGKTYLQANWNSILKIFNIRKRVDDRASLALFCPDKRTLVVSSEVSILKRAAIHGPRK